MHEKSKLGSALDKVKITTLLIFLVSGILVSAGLFFLLNEVGQGIKPTFTISGVEPEINILDCLYFSVVTISSLGYGDYRPIGVGRILASLEVVYGLFFLAVIVSKLASERTSTITKLVYASDTQRRLLEFIESTKARNESMKEAIRNSDYFLVSEISLKNKTAFDIYKQFLEYHLQYGDIDSPWVMRQLSRLVKAVGDTVELANVIIGRMHTDTEIHQRIDNYLGKALILADYITKNYNSDRISNIRESIARQQEAFTKSTKACKEDFAKLRFTASVEITPSLLTRVMHSLPSRPWPPHVHKLVASELRIANSLAQRAITILMRAGHFPDPNSPPNP